MGCVINAKFLGQQITGSQQVGLGLSTYLRQELKDAKFVTTKAILHKGIADELNAVSVGNKNNIYWEQVELPRYLKTLKNPLLVDFGNTAPAFYRNKISTILDISSVIHPEWFSYKSGNYLRFITGKYIKYSRKLIAVSEYTKQTIIDQYNVDPAFIEVVYNSCPEIYNNAAHLNNSEVEMVKQEFGDFILAVSSLDPRKNFLGLVKAFKKAKLKGIKLVIVGSENKVFADTGLKQEIGNDSSIIFTGYISTKRLILLYRTAMFFVYPSFFEGFGIPPLEAMKCNCPVIVSNITSMPEVCGNAALYINPYDLDSLVDGLKQLYLNEALRVQLKEKGLQRAEFFSWKKAAEKLIHVINNV